MRKLVSTILAGLIFVIAAVYCQTVHAEQTNVTTSLKSGFDLPALPPQFDGMTTNNDVHSGITTLAIYQYRRSDQSKQSEAAFACVGNLFQTGKDEFSLLLPEHVFKADGDKEYTYAFRVVRPDSRRIDGYVGEIVMKSIDFFGCDIVLASISTKPTPIKGFSTILGRDGLVIVFTDKVTTRGLRITKLRSHITGKPVTIIGYALKPTEKLKEFTGKKDYAGKVLTIDEERPLIAIEESYMGGKSGSAFVDEHDRIFFVHRALKNDSGELQEEEAIFKERFGRLPKGITLITGPIMVERIK
ncbi:MAG: hypothetical protein Q7S86_04205 [bacterium]|nr:hypothetical protein [bacterium]